MLSVNPGSSLVNCQEGDTEGTATEQRGLLIMDLSKEHSNYYYFYFCIPETDALGTV